MSKKTRIDIIADNGGGITLQYHGRYRYTHMYDDGEQVINDLRAIVDGDGPESWDGNDYEETGFDGYDGNQESNGGYRWYEGTAKELLSEFSGIDPDDAWGYNVAEMAAAAKA